MFVAARVVCVRESLHPRKMVKVSAVDTCGTILNNLMENVNNSSSFVIESICGYTDVNELEESQIKLDVNDDISNIIELGYKFIVFYMGNRCPTAKELKFCAKSMKSPDGTTDKDTLLESILHSNSTDHSTCPATTQSPNSFNLSDAGDLMHYLCICGRSVLRSTRKSHEKYCPVIRSQRIPFVTAAPDAKSSQGDSTASNVHKCDCGASFESLSTFNDHCSSCDRVNGAVFQCLCDKKYVSIVAQRAHAESCSKCRMVPKGSEASALYQKIFLCACGETCVVKSELIDHCRDCDVEWPRSTERVCLCGVIIMTRWHLNAHKKYCPVALSGLNNQWSDKNSFGVGMISFADNKESSRVDTEVVPDKFELVKRRHAAQENCSYREKRVYNRSSTNEFDKEKSGNGNAKEQSNRRCPRRTKAAKPAKGSGPLAMPKENPAKRRKVQADPDTQFEVDMILLHTGNVSDTSKIHFLIRWKGYDSTEDCWLPYDECKDLKALDDYCTVHQELSSLLNL